MINRILEFSLRQRAVVLLGAALLLAIGLWSARQLPIDAVPDITGAQVQINTEIPALAAEESEKLVTQPIELELAGLPGVQEMRSRVVEAEAQIPMAMAEAFRSGNLGIMDYYRMRNVQADTAMRENIANPAQSGPTTAPVG